jgi:hypothetical protein
MKKISALFLLLFISLGMTAFHPVAEPFEGTIRYETSTTGDVPKFVTDRLAKHYDLSFKNNDVNIKGVAPLKGEIFIKKDARKMYIVRTDQKNIYEFDLNDERFPANVSQPVITRTKETLVISGYTCHKYQVEYSKNIKLYAWTSQTINVEDWKGDVLFGSQVKLPEKIDGFPLKIQFISPIFTLTYVATVVKPAAIDPAEFILPEGMALKKL